MDSHDTKRIATGRGRQNWRAFRPVMHLHENHYTKRAGVAGIRARDWRVNVTICFMVVYRPQSHLKCKQLYRLSKMNEKLLELKQSVDKLHASISDTTFQRENLIEWGQYTFPFLHIDDLAFLPEMISAKISKMGKYVPSEDDIAIIDSIIVALSQAEQNIAHLNNVNVNVCGPAISSYLISMLYINAEVNELFSFEVMKDKDLLPKKIINKLDFYSANLQSIEDRTGNIESKINTINEAYDAAEVLPTTLKSLRDTNSEILTLKETSSRSAKIVGDSLETVKADCKTLSDLKKDLEQLGKDVEKNAADYLSELKIEAQNYIDKCEEAFRTTTSKGLAGAFQEKAEKLNISIRWWVGGLIASLGAGAAVGYTRLHALEAYLSNPDSSGVKLAIQLILSFLSVGAPLWFAWLSTKQIGQRFRLAEDYEFKASVSKAYEGYRREAVQLDSDFSQRLFGNALTRLEEPPLRFVEEKTHSSPIMEVLSSDNFRKVIEDGGDRMDAILEKAGLIRKKSAKNEERVKPELSAVENGE